MVSRPFWAWMMMILEAVSARRDPRIRFMMIQLEILKSRLDGNRVILSPEERARLLKMGEALDHDVDGLMGIVSVKTYRRWVRDKTEGKPARQVGRRRTITPSLHKLIVRLARENHLWGARRILGELLKLGLTPSRSTVRRVLRDEGILPDPDRSAMSGGTTPWQTFLTAHLNCTVACDFLCKSVWTPFGKKTAYLLVFIHLGSRRVFVSPSTYHPKSDWVQQQGRNLLLWADEENINLRFLLRDNDAKFTQAFDSLFKTEEGHVVKTPIRAPIANAYAESWIGSFKRECLNHFLCFSLRHLDHIAHAYSGYYNKLRPHQSLGNAPLNRAGQPPPEPPRYSLGPVGRIERQKILGGLLNYYQRKAA